MARTKNVQKRRDAAKAAAKAAPNSPVSDSPVANSPVANSPVADPPIVNTPVADSDSDSSSSDSDSDHDSDNDNGGTGPSNLRPVKTKQPRRKPITAAKGGLPKTIRRRKPGQCALLEIRKYQQNGELLIPRAPFARLVREISDEVARKHLGWEAAAVEALQYVAEEHLTVKFSMSQDAAFHAKRQTIQTKDMELLDTWERKRSGGI